jgi:hypothetical protein
MKYRHWQILDCMYSMVGENSFFYSDVGEILRCNYGINGAIMRKFVKDKIVRVVSTAAHHKNGDVKPKYRITPLGVTLVFNGRDRMTPATVR